MGGRIVRITREASAREAAGARIGLRARAILGLSLGLAAGSVEALRATGALWLTPPEVAAAWAAALGAWGAAGLALALVVRTRRGVVALAVVASLLTAAGAIQPLSHLAPRAVSQGPSVLLITVDTARGDRYGTSGIRTPAHDLLAREGVRFSSAWAQIPVTGPSHAALLSGRSPWDNRMLFNGDPVPGDIPSLAERLSSQGWDTGAFVSASVLRGGLGYARGFSVYGDDFGRWRGLDRTSLGRLLARPAPVERDGAMAVDEAMGWIESRTGPWLCWVHLFEPHGPYEPPPPLDRAYYPAGRDPRSPSHTSLSEATGIPSFMGPSLAGITDAEWVVAQYEGEISHADQQVNRLLQHLDHLGHRDDTLVVLTADHGEGLGERGEWFKHGGMLYDHDLHVPLVMRYPGVLPEGLEVHAPVELGDVAPTLLELLELAPEPGHTGASLVPVISGGAPPREVARSMAWDEETARRAGVSSTGAARTWRLASVRSSERRAIVYEDPSHPAGSLVVGTDGADASARGTPEEAAARGLLDAWDASTHAQRVRLEDRRALEALGYLEPE